MQTFQKVEITDIQKITTRGDDFMVDPSGIFWNTFFRCVVEWNDDLKEIIKRIEQRLD